MEERDQIARFVSTWREAGPVLAEQKRRELQALSTPEALAQLADMFEHALRTAIPSDTSGLVEQQRYFQKLAR